MRKSKVFKKFETNASLKTVLVVIFLVLAVIYWLAEPIAKLIYPFDSMSSENYNQFANAYMALDTYIPILLIIVASLIAIMVAPFFLKWILIGAIVASVAWLINSIFKRKSSNNLPDSFGDNVFN